jgi:hypothetical protein
MFASTHDSHRNAQETAQSEGDHGHLRERREGHEAAVGNDHAGDEEHRSDESRYQR